MRRCPLAAPPRNYRRNARSYADWLRCTDEMTESMSGCTDSEAVRLKSDPGTPSYNDYTSHNTRGIILHQHFKYYEASRKSYQKTIQTDPTDVAAYNKLGTTREPGKPTSEQYNDPNDASAHNNLGYLLEQHFRDHEGSRKEIEKAVHLDPHQALHPL
eukprot:gene11171-2025_t